MNRLSLCIYPLLLLLILPGCKKKDGEFYSESSRPGTADAPVKDIPKDVLATQQGFTNVAKTVTPAVVNISTVSKKKLVQPFFEFSPLFDDFFGGRQMRPQYRREKSLGSGFIINKEGYIITNDHVVRDAEMIQVALSDERTYTAKVIGSDQKTDIAVIKITADEDFPTAVLGDSDKLQVGQWAIAIGNPFGLNRTVTVGVVSATGRADMGIETYEDFIQTDASINPGNSGGPLLNIYGEVIGINTAIVAAGQGIGFAIPINMAKHIVDQLVKKGTVTRGWLGVAIQPLTEEIARSFGYKGMKGALVSDVMEGSPASKAGIRQGDIITRFNGAEIKDSRQLQLEVAETPVGKTVAVELFREGKSYTLSVTVANSDTAPSARAKGEEGLPADEGLFGMSVEELPKSLRAKGASGVIVAGIDPEGIAADAGIQQGDIIVSVDRKKIGNLNDYLKAMKDVEQKGSVAFLVRRGNNSIYFALRLR